ncbi:hypothetical protein V8E55_008015 [Tylopilus felleus]
MAALSRLLEDLEVPIISDQKNEFRGNTDSTGVKSVDRALGVLYPNTENMSLRYNPPVVRVLQTRRSRDLKERSTFAKQAHEVRAPQGKDASVHRHTDSHSLQPPDLQLKRPMSLNQYMKGERRTAERGRALQPIWSVPSDLTRAYADLNVTSWVHELYVDTRRYGAADRLARDTGCWARWRQNCRTQIQVQVADGTTGHARCNVYIVGTNTVPCVRLPTQSNLASDSRCPQYGGGHRHKTMLEACISNPTHDVVSSQFQFLLLLWKKAHVWISYIRRTIFNASAIMHVLSFPESQCMALQRTLTCTATNPPIRRRLNNNLARSAGYTQESWSGRLPTDGNPQHDPRQVYMEARAISRTPERCGLGSEYGGTSAVQTNDSIRWRSNPSTSGNRSSLDENGMPLPSAKFFRLRLTSNGVQGKAGGEWALFGCIGTPWQCKALPTNPGWASYPRNLAWNEGGPLHR